MNKPVKVSILIPLYNAMPFLPELLTKLEQQQGIAPEYIFFDSMSTDGTREYLKEKGYHYADVAPSEFDHGGTRRQMALKAKTEYLIFLTQDALPENENSLRTLVDPLIENKKIAVSYGRQLPHKNTNAFAAHLRLFNYPEQSLLKTYNMRETLGIKTALSSDSFAAYRKSALQEVDYFQEGLILGEDMLSAARLLKKGHAVHYNADARCYHSHNYTIAQDLKRYFDTGVFHTNHPWLMTDFGSATGEGKKFVLSELKYLLKKGRVWLLPVWFLRNLAKYGGYKLGRKYKKFSPETRIRLSMHKKWWG